MNRKLLPKTLKPYAMFLAGFVSGAGIVLWWGGRKPLYTSGTYDDASVDALSYTARILYEALEDTQPIRTSNMKKFQAFLEELFLLYDKYNISISHEDSQGAFILEENHESNKSWMADAIKTDEKGSSDS